MFAFLGKLSLSVKIITMLVVVVSLVAVTNLTLFLTRYEEDVDAELVKQALAFTAVADAAKDHASTLQASGVYNMPELLADLKSVQESGRSYKDSKLFPTLPVVAGWTAARAAAEREKIEFHIPAFEARNPQNDPSTDSKAGPFRTKLLQDLTAQVKSGNREPISRIDTAQNKLHVMRPVILDASCLSCHGDKSQDPTGAGKDILGFPMEGWKVGDMHGAYEVVLPLDRVNAQVATFTRNTIIISAGIALAGTAAFMLALRWMLSRPLSVALDKFRSIGKGDLTQRLETTRTDEIGVLASTLNEVATGLSEVVSEVTTSADSVAAAATELAASSDQMANGMKTQSDQLGRVSAAMLEMNGSVREITQKAAEASTQTRAAGTEASSGQSVVAKTVEEIDAIAKQVDESSVSMEALGKKTEEIGAVIRVITEIAEQTNLLALNAAIEAARAGEHGRGFAVVADEVRKLAERTQNATEEVGASIRQIQEQTRAAVTGMEANRDRVKRGVELAREAGTALGRIVSGSETAIVQVNSIAAATEQQGAASDDITRSIEQINAVCSDTSNGAAEGVTAAASVSQQAERLKMLMRRFTLSPQNVEHKAPRH